MPCLVLGVAVQCDVKEANIETISELDFEVQKHLKEAIENLTCDIYRAYLQPDLASPPPIPTYNAETHARTPSVEDDETSRQNLVESMDQLLADREAQDRLHHAEISGTMERLCAAETEILRRDALIESLNRSLEAAQTRISSHAIEISNLVRSHEVALSVAADEIDALRTRAFEADKLDNKVELLRNRLEALVDTKEQLLSEVAAHKESQCKLTLSERELSVLRPLKGLVEEYKIQVSELSVALDEVREEFARKSAQYDALVKVNENLSAAKASFEEERRFLREELRARDEGSSANEDSCNLGNMEMTEVSPALRIELERLREENNDLRARIDQTTTAAVDALNKKLDDQLCCNQVLQTKWFDAKALLEAKIAEIAEMEKHTVELEKMRDSLLQHIDELTAMHLEETRNLSLRWEIEKQSLFAANEDLETRQSNIQSQLSTVKNQVSKLTSEKETAESNLIVINEQADRMKEELLSINQRHVMELNEKELEWEGRISQIKEQQTQQQFALDEKVAAVVVASNKRQSELSGELDEERVKRRKIEREKKLLEQELHRYKSQAQTAGAGGADEVEAAMNEIKRMQSELDNANAELDVLRAAKGEAQDAVVTTRSQSRSLISSNVVVTNDKRIEQLTKERRELIAKSLEENKEKMQLAQRLLAAEKELAAAKGRLTKLTLENERNARKLNNAGVCTVDENLTNS